MLKRLQQRASSESGFTLIELLVVMLILGILAAIAITAFLNQRDKASDANAKTIVRTMQTAEEACSTSKGGDYTNCSKTELQAIEPAIQIGKYVTDLDAINLGANAYTVYATSSTGTKYTIQRSGGTFTRTCTATGGKGGPGTGGCQPSGTNGSTW